MRNSNLPLWKITNGWREVFARIFADIDTQFNVTPEWLVNPTTNRRLKLDMLYEDIGIAVRFEGLSNKKRRRRPGLDEAIQQRVRDDARVSVSQEHDIQLISVKLTTENLKTVFQQIDAALGRIQHLGKNEAFLPKIKAARATAAKLARNINTPNNLSLYADLWEDRQYRVSEPTNPQPATTATISYTVGMAVEHTIFGLGIVLSTTPGDDDTLITIDFDTAGQKTLAASLVANKLLPR